MAQLTAEAEEAAKALQQADERPPRPRTLLEQARRSLQELHRLEGAKVVPALCGQALTRGHFEEEKRRRETAAGQAEAKAQQAAADQQTAREARAAAADAVSGGCETALEEARDEYQDGTRQREPGRKDVERLPRECGQTYQRTARAVPRPRQPEPPADWLATVYPTAADLAQLRRGGQRPGRRPAAAARGRGSACTQWHGLKAQEATPRDPGQRLAGGAARRPQGLRARTTPP